MRTLLPLGLLILGLLIGCAPEPEPAHSFRIVQEDPSDAPLPGLSDALQARFDLGDVHFEAVFRAPQGLGPLYIRHACVSCHADDAKGPGAVTKMVRVESDGFTPASDQSMLAYGHTVRPQRDAGALAAITTPNAPDVKISKRFGPAVFGRGYLEAIADEEIERVEREQNESGLVSGRINWVVYRSEPNPEPFDRVHFRGARLIGRFGLKARVATLDDFAADAYQGDMGITSPMRPEELPNPDALIDDHKPGVDVNIDAVNAVADYVRLLAIPKRALAVTAAGAATFVEAQCASCHVPTMRTRADYPIPPLRDIDAPIFSDLLLHDMGVALADGIVEDDAGPREWRTAPLIGMRHLRNFLHDGRAATIEEAIVAHASEGSEANESVARFDALDAEHRAELIDYVSRL